MGAELFRADKQTVGRTDGRTGRQTERRDEANSRVSEFCKCA